MSGGTFNYQEMHIERMAEYVRSTYLKHKSKEWILFAQTHRDEYFQPYSKETLAVFKRAYKILRMAYICAKCIDYLQSGDDDEQSFLEKIRQKEESLNKEFKDSFKVSPEDVESWKTEKEDSF